MSVEVIATVCYSPVSLFVIDVGTFGVDFNFLG